MQRPRDVAAVAAHTAAEIDQDRRAPGEALSVGSSVHERTAGTEKDDGRKGVLVRAEQTLPVGELGRDLPVAHARTQQGQGLDERLFADADRLTDTRDFVGCLDRTQFLYHTADGTDAQGTQQRGEIGDHGRREMIGFHAECGNRGVQPHSGQGRREGLSRHHHDAHAVRLRLRLFPIPRVGEQQRTAGTQQQPGIRARETAQIAHMRGMGDQQRIGKRGSRTDGRTRRGAVGRAVDGAPFRGRVAGLTPRRCEQPLQRAPRGVSPTLRVLLDAGGTRRGHGHDIVVDNFCELVDNDRNFAGIIENTAKSAEDSPDFGCPDSWKLWITSTVRRSPPDSWALLSL